MTNLSRKICLRWDKFLQIVNYDKFKNCDGCFQNHQIGTILPNSFVKFFIENWMLVLKIAKYEFNLFHPIGAFHIETNDLFCFLGWNSQSKPSYLNLRQTYPPNKWVSKEEPSLRNFNFGQTFPPFFDLVFPNLPNIIYCSFLMSI